MYMCKMLFLKDSSPPLVHNEVILFFKHFSTSLPVGVMHCRIYLRIYTYPISYNGTAITLLVNFGKIVIAC